MRVYGHTWAQHMLQNAVLSDRSAHAYLFTGPDQVGKTTLARAFAQALTCENPTPGAGLGACGVCRACRLAAANTHPDHRIIEPVGGQLKIDQIRDLIREAAISPVEGRYKVFIVRSFERANQNSANALLKTLEEPSATTRILLTSSQAATLLPTIVSRCQVLNLRPLPLSLVAQALVESWHVPPDRAELLAGLSNGRLGWAVRVTAQPQLWEAHERRLSLIPELTRAGVVARLAAAERFASADDIETAVRDWLYWWRDVLLLQQGCEAQVVHRDRIELLRSTARATSPTDVRRFIDGLMTTAGHLRSNVNTRLAVEVLFLKIPRMASL